MISSSTTSAPWFSASWCPGSSSGFSSSYTATWECGKGLQYIFCCCPNTVFLHQYPSENSTSLLFLKNPLLAVNDQFCLHEARWIKGKIPTCLYCNIPGFIRYLSNLQQALLFPRCTVQWAGSEMRLETYLGGGGGDPSPLYPSCKSISPSYPPSNFSFSLLFLSF
jgi:hypothetical protein